MKTKIIATIGPSSDNKKILKEMIDAGVNIIRVNFSHANSDWFVEVNRLVKKIDKNIPIIMDLKGPRLRIGDFPAPIFLSQGQELIFSTVGCSFKNKDGCLVIEDPFLDKDIKIGDPIFINNGLIELVTTKVTDKKIYTKTIMPGSIYSRAGVNLPNTKLTTSGLTKKDIRDVRLGIEQGVDYIALSFVQSKEDVQRLRELIVGTNIKIIAKIERNIAIKNIDEIVLASDSVMIARGDLGTEIPIEKVPIIQKYIIKKAHWQEKGVIVATQMLVHMISKNTPTRAEVSDIATAVFDGTDAVMLSEETAIGDYPVKSVETMLKVIKEVEKYLYQRKSFL